MHDEFATPPGCRWRGAGCNVAALSICDIYKINTSQIKAVLDENPELHREMLAIAESREAINANIEQKVSMFASVTSKHQSRSLVDISRADA